MKKECGFTLTELMVVVAIVAVLSAIAVPMYMDNVKKSKVQEAADTIGAIKDEINGYISEKGSIPPLCDNHGQIRNTVGVQGLRAGSGRIGSGTTALSLPGHDAHWGLASGADGFDAPPKSV